MKIPLRICFYGIIFGVVVFQGLQIQRLEEQRQSHARAINALWEAVKKVGWK